MGNIASAGTQYEPAHVRIYANLLRLGSHETRAKMIDTILAGPEYIVAAKRAGIYSWLLTYSHAVRSGGEIPLLPGEKRAQPQQHRMQPQPMPPPQPSVLGSITSYVSEKLNPWAQVAKKPQEKALSYFNSCLEILGLQEDVILTEAELKAAYKKAAIKVHPDKGGSEEMFQAVTKAYTYLSEILKRIQGAMGQGQAQAQGPAQAPQQVATQRAIDEEKWQHIQPVHLSAKKLDINAFNSLYEKTRMPDPDDEGYGDWLKTEDQGSGATGRRFDGKFNRDVFNSAFEGAEREKPTQALTVQHPRSMALTMAPSMGTEIGRTSTDDYTAPANADVQYTDLKRAYTSDSTFTNKVADVKVEVRTMDRYAAEREKAPVLSAYEQSQIALEEERMTAVESQRERRLAAQREQEEKYFQQMKRLAIMNK